jgi:cardiolipin synthase
VHFRVEGAVVSQLEAAFFEDWSFASHEAVSLEPAPETPAPGGTFARGISDGPNEDFEQLVWILLGAVHAARRTIRVVTPYFLPDRELEAALVSAAMRGVEVEILLPGRNNLPYVHWACMAMLPPLLERGVRVFLQPRPFDHSKLLLVDEHYAMVGSANLDPRSLRLNFEYQLELYGDEPATSLNAHFEACRDAARQLTLEELSGRRLWQKVRDNVFRLFQPYL